MKIMREQESRRQRCLLMEYIMLRRKQKTEIIYNYMSSFGQFM